MADPPAPARPLRLARPLTPSGLREVWNGAMRVLGKGCRGRSPPRGFPPHGTVCYDFHERHRAGLLEAANGALRRRARPWRASVGAWASRRRRWRAQGAGLRGRAERWVVERAFSWVVKRRRLRVDDEERARTSVARV